MGSSTPPPSLLSPAFTHAFAHVFFVPGNPDVWLRGAARDDPLGPRDSMAKWAALERALNALGVRTRAARLPPSPASPAPAPWIVPLLSWYAAPWDGEPDVPGAPAARSVFTDFRACVWPPALAAADGAGDGGVAVAAAWDALNDEAALAAVPPPGAPGRPPVIAAAHFLPHQSLLPEKRYLFQPNLAKVAGSPLLARRVGALAPDVCVFGHTHLDMDRDVPFPAAPCPVRCVQRSLRYPAERRRMGVDAATVEPQLIWDGGGGDGGRGAWGPRSDTHWTRHYRLHARVPADVRPAPWVLAAWGRGGGGGAK
jgi:hypothetical protein